MTGLPSFCDLSCRHASFPDEEALDGARSCRTFAALRCARKGAYVLKNLPCPLYERRTPGGAGKGASARRASRGGKGDG